MISIDNMEKEKLRIRTSIDMLSAEIETLVEATYRERADIHLMEVINTKRVNDTPASLF